MTNAKEDEMIRLSAIALAAAMALSLLASSADAVKPRGGSGGGSSGTKAVQVRQIEVKATPNYLTSTTVGRLNYGDRVEVVAEEGNWYRIAKPAGYIPTNAVGRSAKSVDASQGYAGGGVTHDETALAGKGFNPQVESQYKKSSASLAAAYVKVDRVERMTVSDATLKSFMAQGQLK